MSGDHNMYFSGNQPDSEALKLARECGFAEWHGTDDVEFLKAIEAFYGAAFNAGLEAAAKHIESDMHNYAPCIRALKVEV